MGVGAGRLECEAREASPPPRFTLTPQRFHPHPCPSPFEGEGRVMSIRDHMRNNLVALAAALTLAAPPAWAQDDLGPASLPTVKTGTAVHAMVAAANPLAVAAGVKVLRAGGNAMAAAVAVQAVL